MSFWPTPRSKEGAKVKYMSPTAWWKTIQGRRRSIRRFLKRQLRKLIG